jgi:acetolactate synthase-1/2/3 large subunit
MMAEAWGKLTGKPGIIFATRGPGAANAMSGLHVAQQDQTPMILFLGLPSTRHESREAFQEIAVRQLFSSYVKWVGVVRQVQRIPEYVSRAYSLAMSGRPGPVVVGLPEDVLAARIDVADALPVTVSRPVPSPADMARVAELVQSARRPLMIVGGPGWSAQAAQDVAAFAARTRLPVAVGFRCQDYVDNRHPCYVGHAGVGMEPQLAAAIRAADLLLVVGDRLGEITTLGYTLLDAPNPRQRLIHVHPDPDETGSVFMPELPITSTGPDFIAALAATAIAEQPGWGSLTAELRAAYEQSLTPRAPADGVDLASALRHMSDRLPADAIVTSGAGNYAAFTHKHFVYKDYGTQLAPRAGSMGYGLPAALAAKLVHPNRTVVAMAGDGCLMMTVQELATAVQYDLPIVVVVVNNGTFGTIRMHQEKAYPARVVGTSIKNPDFAALARSFGAEGERVESTAEFPAALDRALAAGKPALIELVTSTELISPRRTITELRAGG